MNLADLSTSDLIKLYNASAVTLGKKQVKAFHTKAVAIERVEAIQAEVAGLAPATLDEAVDGMEHVAEDSSSVAQEPAATYAPTAADVAEDASVTALVAGFPAWREAQLAKDLSANHGGRLSLADKAAKWKFANIDDMLVSLYWHNLRDAQEKGSALYVACDQRYKEAELAKVGKRKKAA